MLIFFKYTNYYEWCTKVCEYLKQKVEKDDNDKIEEWGNLAIKNVHHILTTDSVYDKPDVEFFNRYVNYINEPNLHEEVPDYMIPLNLPPVPKLIRNEYDANFMRNLEEATNYILYAATACTRLRVNEEITQRSKLRWYSVLADLYDRYKEVINQMPSLKDGDRRVKEASEIAEEKRKDRLKRKVLAKEVMAGRRINKILTALKGQWHVIELHDFITREFLINNDAEFFDRLINGISWPEMDHNNLPYKLVPDSGSTFQFALLDHEEGGNNNEEDEEMEDFNNEEMEDVNIEKTVNVNIEKMVNLNNEEKGKDTNEEKGKDNDKGDGDEGDGDEGDGDEAEK